MVLLKPLPNKEVSDGGVFFPQGSMEDVTSLAEVIAVGPGKYNDEGVRKPMQLRVGDKVALLRFHLDNMKVEVDGETYSLVAEPDIWAAVVE